MRRTPKALDGFVGFRRKLIAAIAKRADIDFISKVEGRPINRSDHTQWWDPLRTQPWTATAFEACLDAVGRK